MLQKKDNVVRAVCFSPQKHTQLHTFQQTKSPVKVSNYGKSQLGKDVIFNQHTKIAPIDNTNIDFPHSNKLTTTGMAISISSLNDLAGEQLVTLKAQVAQISGVKRIETQHQGRLNKQEVILRDVTGSIKAILWQSRVDTLKENTTYILKNLKIKTSRGEKYLNTPKDEEFQATETTPFNQPLVQVDGLQFELASSTISAKVIGVHQVTNTIS